MLIQNVFYRSFGEEWEKEKPCQNSSYLLRCVELRRRVVRPSPHIFDHTIKSAGSSVRHCVFLVGPAMPPRSEKTLLYMALHRSL